MHGLHIAYCCGISPWIILQLNRRKSKPESTTTELARCMEGGSVPAGASSTSPAIGISTSSSTISVPRMSRHRHTHTYRAHCKFSADMRYKAKLLFSHYLIINFGLLCMRESSKQHLEIIYRFLVNLQFPLLLVSSIFWNWNWKF